MSLKIKIRIKKNIFIMTRRNQNGTPNANELVKEMLPVVERSHGKNTGRS
jgi:hypothetical protein